MPCSRTELRKCKGKDHWVNMCKTKQKKAAVNQVQEEQTSEHQVRVTSGLESNMLTVSVSVGMVYVNLKMLVDSGATNNIIGVKKHGII